MRVFLLLCDMAETLGPSDLAQRLALTECLDRVCSWNWVWRDDAALLPSRELLQSLVDYRLVSRTWREEVNTKLLLIIFLLSDYGEAESKFLFAYRFFTLPLFFSFVPSFSDRTVRSLWFVCARWCRWTSALNFTPFASPPMISATSLGFAGSLRRNTW
jgi:hypothetical protein